MNTKNISKRTPKGTAANTATQQTSPEPKDRRSAEWRAWKVEQMRAA